MWEIRSQRIVCKLEGHNATVVSILALFNCLMNNVYNEITHCVYNIHNESDGHIT